MTVPLIIATGKGWSVFMIYHIKVRFSNDIELSFEVIAKDDISAIRQALKRKFVREWNNKTNLTNIAIIGTYKITDHIVERAI